MYEEALLNKRPATVAVACQQILDRAGVVPTALVSDKGAEFCGPLQAVVAADSITYTHKQKGDINAIATLDTAVDNLTKALARGTMKQRTNH